MWLSHLLAACCLGWAVMAALPASAKEPLRLAFITCCRDEAFFRPVKKGMTDAARGLHVQCDFLGTPGVDLPAQAALVRKAVADGYDGIAVNLIDPVAFDEVVAEARRKGVAVVAFNCDDATTPNARQAAVCQDFRQAGRRVATEAAAFIPAGSTVLVTQHDRGISSLDDRLQGIREGLQAKHIPFRTLVAGNDPPQALERISAELKKDPQIQVVLGTGLTDTEAAGLAIERDFPHRGYAAAGFDLTPTILRLIRQGVIRFTTDQQPYTQGFYPVVQLTLYCRYGIQPSNLDAGAGIIRAADVDRVEELTGQQYR